VRPDDLPQEFEIDQTPIWPEEDGRLEPIFLAGPLWFGLEEPEEPDPKLEPGVPEVPLVEFDEFLELDPARGEDGPNEPPPEPRQRAGATSLFGSLGVHLLPLLALIGWSSAPAELPGAIPVGLVIEEASATPDEAPPDRLVAETTGETPREAPVNADSRAAAAPSPPAPPPQPKLASVTPQPAKPSPPKPGPPPEPASKQPAPTPMAQPTAAQPTAAQPPPVPPTAASGQLAPTPNPAPREAAVPSPDPARSDYFDHLVALTRDHLDLLPVSFLAGRRGQTILSIVVQGDGTIGRISVKHSSGYPDIDTRIEQMVAAVGRFPPPPESFEKPSVELDFNLAFPDALQQ
jgi:TonB family protein